jgi:cell division septation protein DedD
MIRTWKDVEKESLPEGMSLRYARQEEEKSAEPPLEGKPWVITIQSLQSPGGLAAPAIKLVQNGYLTYITRAVVKGTHWLRLRVGFYGSKAEAMAAKKKILKILGKDDSWVARAGKSELEEYGDR